jgi:hypothetical protein
MSLSDELISLIPKSEAKEAFLELAEVGLDAILDDGVLKDIPIIGTLTKAGSAVITIRDRLFIRKVARFLTSINEIPDTQRRKFVTEHFSDTASRQRIGEKLLLIIDKQDDLNKTELIGYIFKKFIEGVISRDDFDLLAHSVSHAHIPDLEHLHLFTSGLRLGDDALGSALFALNLAEIKVHVSETTWDGTSNANVEYVLSTLGKKLAEIIKQYEERA